MAEKPKPAPAGETKFVGGDEEAAALTKALQSARPAAPKPAPKPKE